MRKKTIFSLKCGEAVPSGSPARYYNGAGYVRLRWKLGPRHYVETYEHRVIGGYVTDAEQVHHRNKVRDDNRPENLEHLTEEEHAERHASPDVQTIVALYENGISTTQIARYLNRDESAVFRLLQRRGIPLRGKSGSAKPIDEDSVRLLHAAGVRVQAMARVLGVGVPRIEKTIDALGLPRFKPGRPPYARPSKSSDEAGGWSPALEYGPEAAL